MNNVVDYFRAMLKNSTPQNPLWQHERNGGRWDYVDGCVLKAALDWGELEYVREYINTYISDDGNIATYCSEDYNCDNINEGKVLFPLYAITGNEKYRRAIERLMTQLLYQPRTPEGNFWHKQIYPNQIWLDGLYMVQPFYIEYALYTRQDALIQDSLRQFSNVRRLMRDPETGLYYHAYDASRESFWCDKQTGCSPNFWSRAMGWFAMALVDAYELVHAEELSEILRELLDALLPYRDTETHQLYQVTNLPNEPRNYKETSASCAIAYAFMKGARTGALPASYAIFGIEMLDGVLRNKFDGNDLTDICLVAGLGGMPGKGSYNVRDGSVAYYLSEPRVTNDGKGVAALMFAVKERGGVHTISPASWL